jgi:hypothetical protein
MAKSYLKTYFILVLVVIVAIGCLNLLVDPLWYKQGNMLTGVNPPWNERITKTNLFLKDPQAYDCLLLGTSRTTLFNTEFLKDDHCFNYSFSGGKIEELVNYAEYVQRKEINPHKVYIEIDPASLNRRSRPREFAEVTNPLPAYRTYFFSLNTFWLSLRTLLGAYSYSRLYDRTFQGVVSKHAPEYEPEFDVENEDNKGCDPQRLEFYQTLKQRFPNAQLVGYVAPTSAWRVYNTQYANRLINCQLAGIHQLTHVFDAIYDFSLPSELTTRTDNTYDGNHYYPTVFQKIAEVLEGRRSDVGIKVNDYPLPDYQQLYANRIKAFLEQQGESERWQG